MQVQAVKAIGVFFQYMFPVSLRASLLVLLAYAVRFTARRMPGKYRCMIWMAVFFAFICPASFGIQVTVPQEMAVWKEPQTSGVVFIEAGRRSTGAADAERQDITGIYTGDFASGTAVRGNTDNEVQKKAFQAEEDSRNPVSETDTAGGEEGGSHKIAAGEGGILADIRRIIPILWLLTGGVLLLWQIVCYFRMRSRLRTAVKYSGGIFITDQISSPVLFGCLYPQIYLPGDMEQEAMDYAVLHEQMHLRRRDYLWKLAAFLICILHWWNPLIWLAYRGFEADMERACDEAVLEQPGVSGHIYARVLAETACRSIYPCAVGLGGSRTRLRVQHILDYHRAGTARRRLSGITAVIFGIVSLLQLQAGAAVSDGRLLLAVSNSQVDWLRPALEQYRKMYPGVEVEVTVYEDIVPAVYQMAAGSEKGRQPDVLVGNNWGMNNLEEMMQDEVFEPLNTFAAAGIGLPEEDYVRPVLDSGSLGGNQYVVPLSYTMCCVVAPKSLLSEAGILQEQSPDIAVFLEAMSSLCEAEDCRWLLANTGLLERFSQILMAGSSEGERDPSWSVLRNACESYAKLSEAGAIVSDIWAFSEGYGDTTASDRIACYIPGDLQEGVQATRFVAATLEPVCFPLRSREGQSVAAVSSYAGICAGSANRQNAWNFLQLLLGEETQQALVRKEKNCVVLKSATENFLRELIQCEVTGEGIGESENETAYWQKFLEYSCNPQCCMASGGICGTDFQSRMMPFYEGWGTYEECIGGTI